MFTACRKSETTTTRAKVAAPKKTGTLCLMEIVGAMGLTLKGRGTIDPYCVVRMGAEQVHRTKTVYDDENPIYTVKTQSLCIIDVPAEPDDRLKAVTVEVCHGFKPVGHVKVPFEDILKACGDRVEYQLELDQELKIDKAFVACRFRRATHDDLLFLGKIKPESSTPAERPGLASDVNFKTVRGKGFFQSDRKKGADKEELFRVKPFPDPDRPTETEFMTVGDIQEEAFKPSYQWITGGQGDVGKLYVEIIGCDNLVNMDLDVGNDNVSDPFVCMVFEDTMVRTNVIWDDLNPRFMPWTSRAFAFNISHPSSILMLGVFDYDESLVDYHDAIGRVVLSTAHYRPNVTYLLHLKLHHDPREMDDRGTVIIRFRVEWSNESEAMKLSFTPAPANIINVDNDKSYQVLRYLARGAVDMEKPSIATCKLYVKELVTYWTAYCYVLDVLFEALLWRGRLRVTESVDLWFPLYSLVIFGSAVVCLEVPSLIVPILLYDIGFVLITINYWASRHPNPWKRVKTTEEVNVMALFGISLYKAETTVVGAGVEEGARIDKLDELKGQRMAALIKNFVYFLLKMYRIYNKSSLSAAKIKAITTQERSFDLLGDRLYYVHMLLKYLCKYIRLFRNFVNWRGYFADVVATNCIVLATAWLILPVNTIAFWCVRLLVWGLLGPWMKLLDVYFVNKWYPTSRELLRRLKEGEPVEPDFPDFDAVLENETFMMMTKKGRVLAEDLIKLKDMREHRFGIYSEQVPVADQSRFPCVPLPQSTAQPTEKSPSHYSYNVPGQHLKGNMIHILESDEFLSIREAKKDQ